MIFTKLRTRMIAHIIWIIAAVMIVTFYFVYKLHVKSIKQHLQNDALIAVDMMENLLFRSMHFQGPATLDYFLPELTKLNHIHKIRIINSKGRIILSSNANDKKKIIEQTDLYDFIANPEDTYSSNYSIGQNTFFLEWRKLINRESCQKCHDPAKKLNGILLIETSDRVTFRALKSDYLVLSGIAVGLIIFLSLATSAIFIRSVDQPVQKLKDVMEAIKRGEFNIHLQHFNQDELGELAQGMNAMAKKLQRANNQLLEHHRQELLQTEALAKIGELSAGLAHEIKNPISGIVFAMNSLLRETKPDDNRQEIFREIVEQANRVEQNLEALLTFARHTRIDPCPTNLNTIVERILLFVRQQTKLNLIKIESELDNDLPIIEVDPKQIEEVLLNLITNAVQAIPEEGRILVKTQNHKEDRTVRIVVQDTGSGIPQKLQEKIFQPFYTTKAKGTGLGLTLSKDIVIRHKGTICFESQPDSGTAFIVELPVGNFEDLS